jgi:predicted nucleic acid-binding protein
LISTQVLSEVAGVLYQRYHVRDPTLQLRALLSYPMRIVDVTPEIVLRAAEYARDYGILPYDGIHVAAALSLLVDEILSPIRA